MSFNQNTKDLVCRLRKISNSPKHYLVIALALLGNFNLLILITQNSIFLASITFKLIEHYIIFLLTYSF